MYVCRYIYVPRLFLGSFLSKYAELMNDGVSVNMQRMAALCGADPQCFAFSTFGTMINLWFTIDLQAS